MGKLFGRGSLIGEGHNQEKKVVKEYHHLQHNALTHNYKRCMHCGKHILIGKFCKECRG